MAARETASAVPKTGRYRWAIVALLFAATTVNYIDRTMPGQCPRREIGMIA